VRVLTISDFHAPFGHPDAIDFLSDLKKEYKPQKIICLGDEIDQASISDWTHSPDGMSPREEYEAAIKQLSNRSVKMVSASNVLGGDLSE